MHTLAASRMLPYMEVEHALCASFDMCAGSVFYLTCAVAWHALLLVALPMTGPSKPVARSLVGWGVEPLCSGLSSRGLAELDRRVSTFQRSALEEQPLSRRRDVCA